MVTYCDRMVTLTTDLASVVREALAAAGYDNDLQVANETGIPRSTLLRRLKGVSAFTVSELVAIAGLVDTPVSELLARAEDAAA